MEFTTIADIIRKRKDIKTDFKIPKRRRRYPKDPAAREAMKHEPESILNEAYDNSEPQPSAYQQVLPQLKQNTNPLPNATPVTPLATPVTPLATPVKPQATPVKAIATLFRPHKEAPKNVKRQQANYSEVQDNTLPKELREQFQPLFCKLCSASLGSTVNAKIHYGSKNHDRKVRRFLVEYAERTGEPLHKRALENPLKKEEEQYIMKHYHCDVCDLPLTGKAHAESHYMGKNHQRVLTGRKTPAGKGFYNADGKFMRIVQTPSDPSREDNFGLDFSQTEPSTSTAPKATSLRCELCQISVTSLPQMDIHLKGQKHQKKLKLSGLAQSPEPANTESSSTSSTQGNMYTSYRTPSGQYYCKVCDISLNSELQFATHLQSRNHSKKSSAVKE